MDHTSTLHTWRWALLSARLLLLTILPQKDGTMPSGRGLWNQEATLEEDSSPGPDLGSGLPFSFLLQSWLWSSHECSWLVDSGKQNQNFLSCVENSY